MTDKITELMHRVVDYASESSSYFTEEFTTIKRTLAGKQLVLVLDETQDENGDITLIKGVKQIAACLAIVFQSHLEEILENYDKKNDDGEL